MNDDVPQDLDAEQLVLGVILLQPRRLDAMLTEARLADSHFHRRSHGAIYAAMVALHERGEGIDAQTVLYELESKFGSLPESARAELELLAGPVPDASNAVRYGQRVVTMAKWRARREKALRRLAAVRSFDEAEYAQLDAEDAVADAGHDGLLTPDALVDRWMNWYDRPGTDVIPTPWPTINEGLFGGLRPGDTTVLAGWSGVGKTVVGDGVLEHGKEERDLSCCAYPNEMSDIDRVSRLLAGRSGVSFRRIMNRKVNPAEAKRILKAAGDLPFAMQPCAGWSADAICAHLRRYKWDVAFIDLATRIPAQNTSDWDYISGAIADAARQSRTHVILAVQLNRERSTGAERPMPVLRDLRNTGAWEQDARNVLFVHRREEIDRDSKVPVMHDDGVIQLAKVSNGQQGVIERVYLNYQRMRYDVLATDDPSRSDF